MFTITPNRLLVALVGAVAFAAMLALAAFSATASAQQEGTNAEQEGASAKEGTDAGGKEVTTEQHAWSSYHWPRKSNPFALTLDDNVSADWESYLTTASTDWSKSEVLDTNVLANQENGSCAPTTGKVEVCNKAYGNTGWSGLAQIWVTKGRDKHITQGVAKMNDTYIKPDDVYKKAHVMCQEVGHTFGLGHQDESGANLGTCMDYSNTASEDGQHPNAHDYEMLRAIYDPTFTSSPTATATGHLDSTRTTKATAASKRGNYDARDQWGQLKYKSEDGKHAVFERQFRDGTALLTFVEVEEPEKILEDQEDQTQDR